MRVGPILLFLGVAGVAFAVWRVATAEKEQPAGGGRPPYVLPVTLAQVERADFVARLTLSGSVRSRRSAQLSFETEGRIAELRVREGDRVEAGAVLARLAGEDERLAVASAEADLALAQSELSKLEAGAREEEKRRLEADLAEAKALEVWAGSSLQRATTLRDQNVGSQATVEQLEAERAAATARVAAAQAALDEAQAGTREEDLAVARARLAVAQAALERARESLRKTELVAPWGGAVVSRDRVEGEHVDAGAAVLAMIDLGQREIEVDVPARWAAPVQAGAPVRVTLDEVPGFALDATLRARMPAADDVSRNFRTFVDVDAQADPEVVLAPGSFVRLSIGLAPIAGALVVPSDAVHVTDTGPIVVRAKPAEAGAPAGGPPSGGAPTSGPPSRGASGGGGPPGAGRHGGPPPLTAEWVPVRVLATESGKSAVEPIGVALTAGDQVVLTGVDIAFPGAPLMPRSDAPSAPGGAPH